jgi:zinc protease
MMRPLCGKACSVLALLALACGNTAGPGAAAPAAPAAPGDNPDQAWREQRPAAAAPRDFDYPGAQTATLPNGVQLWLVPRKSGTVALSINSLAGGAANGAGQSGLAALTLRLMTEATQHKAGLALAEAAESLGTSLDFDTGRDGSSVSLEVLTSDAEAGLALLAEVVTEPRFLAADVERIKTQWLDSLLSERQDPNRLAALAGMRALWGPGMAAPVRGSVPDVQKLKRADLVRFHHDFYVSGNLAVIAVGDLDLPRLTALAQAGLGHLPKRSAPPLPALQPPPSRGQTQVWIIDRPGSVQSALFVGQPFPERSVPGYEAREVMNNLLGGLFTSRLNLNLREKHAYTYGVRSQALALRRIGAFVSTSSVKTESTADALEQLRLELAGLAGGTSPILPDELDRAKTDLIHQLGGNLEHVRRVLGDTAELYVEGLPSDYHGSYGARIRAIDQRAAAAEAARLTPNALAVVIVGDQQKIAPLLAAKGITPLPAPPAFSE